MGTKKIVVGTAKFLGEIILDAAVIIALVLGIRTYIIAPFQVHGTSMCNTLNYRDGTCHTGFGEYLIINKLGYNISPPHRGDIVVFRPPGTIKHNPLESLLKTIFRTDDEEFFIKRVIGLPGETVTLKGGYVYVMNKDHPEGVKLDEPYLSEENSGHTEPLIAGKNTFSVPEGKYLLFGDNRRVSTDARSCFRTSMLNNCQFEGDHYIGIDQMEGRSSIILFPLAEIGRIKTTEYKIDAK